jgi:hypothetical protein
MYWFRNAAYKAEVIGMGLIHNLYSTRDCEGPQGEKSPNLVFSPFALADGHVALA